MPLAFIDIGTNTFNLLIAEHGRNKALKILYKTRIPVKLGQGGIHKGYIGKEPFERGIKALKKYRDIIDEYGAGKVIACATSAVRDAKNGKRFVKEAEKKAGIKIEVISGNREAELIYYGVRKAVSLPAQPILIMDIGGGSTEFIIANNKKIFWKKSFRLGVSRLVEKFSPSDPVKKHEVARLMDFFIEELTPLFRAVKNNPITTLIGSAGSFETFAGIIANRYYLKAKKKAKEKESRKKNEEYKKRDILMGKTYYRFNINDFFKIYRWLLKSTLKERLNTKGIVPFRADTIVAAGILTNAVLQKLAVKKMLLSKYSLREGMMFGR